MARILVCDDALFMRQSLIRILKAEGFEIAAEAGSGEECISQYEIYKPDIVLMDITMPDMDGIEATKRIVQAHKDAKIIMVSAMGQREMVFGAIAAGAKDFVVKPFKSEKIIECVNRYL